MKRLIIAAGISLILLFMPLQAYAMTVIIDPGHGGSDPGAIGINGLKEKDVNLAISLILKQELLNRGYSVVMTRETDRFVSLERRVSIARASKGELFVSIHANAHTSNQAHGSLVLYYDHSYKQAAYPPSSEMAMLSEENRKLAEQVLYGIVQQIDTANRGIVPSSAYVIRNGSVPSILVESAFLSHIEDAALLARDEVRAAIAQGIANGIDRYIPPVFIDLGNHWAAESVLRLEDLGIVHGDDGRFEPNRNMTRAEYMTLLDNVFNFDKLLPIDPAPTFIDLSPSHWAFSQMEKAIQLGILTGYEDGTVRPNQSLTRAEMAVIFDRLALKEIMVGDQTNRFTDVKPNIWYANSVNKLAQHSLITGLTTTNYGPNQYLTRAEAATIVDRYLQSTLRLNGELFTY